MGIIQSQKNLKYTRQFGYHELTNKGVTKQYELTSKQEQESFRNLVIMYKSFDVPTILPIVGSQQINNENGVLYGWRLTFKYLSRTLEQEVNQMTKLGQRYTDEQILKIIDCILSALMGFKLKKLPHGNVNCESIFVDYHPEIEIIDFAQKIKSDEQDENKKIYAIGLPLLLNLNEQQNILNQKQYNKLYLSPLNLMEISQGRNKLSTSQKNDVFALGLLGIRLMLLCNIRQLYDYENLKIRQDLLSRRIFQCRQLYSEPICNLISNMTEKSQKSRPDFQQIFNYCFSLMQGYERNSIQMQNQRQYSNEKTPIKQASNENEPISLNNSKQKYKAPLELFEKKPKLQPDPMYVSSPQLTIGFHKSKESEVAWNKFRNRMMNKNAHTPKNQECY